MTYRLDPEDGLIIVSAELRGPTGSAILRLALDTGATTTVVNTAMLVAVGYDLALVEDRIEMTTGSGVEYAPRIMVNQMTALGITRPDFYLLGHTLPPSAGVDGLLGLDFLREQSITIDFINGEIRIG